MLAEADRWRKEGHHDVPCESIREGIIVKGVKDESRDEAGIEGERHGGRDGAEELSGNSGVLGNGKSFSSFSSVQLLSEFVLNF